MVLVAARGESVAVLAAVVPLGGGFRFGVVVVVVPVLLGSLSFFLRTICDRS